ncbi:DNA-binding transcriptional LysR family regulator [Streptacidiphilus sp. MAP12-16]|uniref:LysR family transcriptional regulator n=1 Tax=Streptacidiphilus sp. MAP12-16 TaxID=3156300 RepID=UPI00351513B8
MDVRTLEYFVAAVECGGFTKAAARLHVTQPTLSEAIRRLERECDAPLFHRVGRGVVLSEAGAVLLTYARRVLKDMEDARQSMIALRGFQGGRVTVSAPPALSIEPLARIVGNFRRAYPDVTVVMLPTEDGALAAAAVANAASEVGLTDRPVSADLRAHPIGSNEIVVVLPPGNALSGKGPVSLEQLAGVPFISSAVGTRARNLLDESKERGIALQTAVETPHREAVIPLILEGVGAAFLPWTVSREAESRGAVVLPLLPRVAYDLLIVHRDQPLTAAAEAFVATALGSSPVGGD